jgi:ABC-type sugar transport system permease subunit
MTHRRLLHYRTYTAGTLFILPAFALFAVFIFIPLVYGLYMSFTDYGDSISNLTSSAGIITPSCCMTIIS